MPFLSDSEGTLLKVDMNCLETAEKRIEPSIWKRFLGGLGLNILLLYRHTGPKTRPLGPENVVIVSPGLLTGTNAPTSPRLEVTTKSPLTGLIGTGNSGGYWGPRLKASGFDSVMITGAAHDPVYLLINEGEASFHKATDLWGLDTYQVTHELKRRHGKDFSIMAIGPAGENQVRFAAPVFDKQHMPGRCHAGAVLGMKKLKAIAVKGSTSLKVKDPIAFSAAVKHSVDRIMSYPAWKARAKSGSMGTIGRNSEGIDYDDIAQQYLKRGEPGVYCQCMMESLYGCDLMANVEDGPYAGLDVVCAGLTLYSLTAAQFGISLPAAFYMNELCQRFGMDMFGPFLYAYDLYRRGIITQRDLGFKLERGDEESLMRLINIVARREGFGDVLAEGSQKAAEKIGGEAPRHVPAVKGLDVMMSDPRAMLRDNVFTTLSILTNPRGGDDLKGTHGVSNYPGVPSWARKLCIPDEEYATWLLNWVDMPGGYKSRIFGDTLDITHPDQVMMTIWYNRLTCAYNSLGICMFSSSVADALGPSYLAELYSAATGIPATWETIMEVGERIYNLMRAYNIREGAGRSEDHWPESFYKESSWSGLDVGPPFSRQHINDTLSLYYKRSGWDESGAPSKKTLKRLGLTDIIGENIS